jgi:hypothetical protein
MTAAAQRFCGRGAGTNGECAGQLEPNWASAMTGDQFRAKVDDIFMKRLSYGRVQPRVPFQAGMPKVPTVVAAFDDADTVQPDRIGSPVVFAMLTVLTATKEKRFELDPSDAATYWMVLQPSPKSDSTQWSLVRLSRPAGGAWTMTIASKPGQWRKCPNAHPAPPYALADFMTCDQAAMFNSEFFSRRNVAKLYLQAVNDLSRTGDEPVWIFCPAGCCEASY